MKKLNGVLVISGILFFILMTFLLIKQNKPSFMTGREVIYLNDASFARASITIGDYVTYDEYLAHKTPPTTVEKVEQKMINGKVVEVVFLGEVGVLGEKLDISYIDTETHLDEDRYNEYMAKKDSSSNNSTDNTEIIDENQDNSNSDNENITDDKNNNQDNDNDQDKTDNDKTDNQNQNFDQNNQDDQNNDQNNQDDQNNNQDDQNTDQNNNQDDNQNNNQTSDEIIRSAAVREYVSPQNSCQRVGYVIYAPENVTANTPIFLFLHGIGQNGASYKSFIGAITFIKYLINGNWTPDVIIVAPICPGGSKWINETANIKAMLNEVTNTFGGNMGNVYIGGFSAGCDSITPIAKEINFRGALYMGGYLGAVGNTISEDEFLSLWTGKNVWYYRDSKYGSGGYGYKANYVSNVEAKAPQYGVNFKHIDMHWPHRSSMIDAILLPPYFTNANGDACLDELNALIR